MSVVPILNQMNQVLNLKHELLKINFNIFVSSLPKSVSSQTDIFTSGCVLHFVCISHMCFATTVPMHGCICLIELPGNSLSSWPIESPERIVERDVICICCPQLT